MEAIEEPRALRKEMSDIEVKFSEVVEGELGVFAKKNIPKETILGKYAGVEMTFEEYEQKYIRSKIYNGYVIQVNVDKYIDGSPPHGDWTSRINANYRSGRLPNVRLTNRGNIVSKRLIRQGEELLFAYGTSYWKLFRIAKKNHWVTV